MAEKFKYEVKAKQYGNEVKFIVETSDIKSALAEALKEAKRVFDYDVTRIGIGETPTVSVKRV